MAETMIERVAEALWNAESVRATDRPRRVQWAEESDKTRENWRQMARAAIEAMRNPPDCVLDAMNPSGRYASTIVPEAWNDAIDAILKEEGE